MKSTMTNNFDRAFTITVGHEGTYVNDPEDKGGETKFGISQRTYPKLDIKNLTLSQAKIIYHQDFWNTKKMNLDLLPVEIAIELFDTGVNMGMKRARMMLQMALNLLNRVETHYDDLKIDGWIGSKTLQVVYLVEQKELLRVLNGLQFMRYFEIVKHNHSQERFFAGWIKRT